LTVAWSCGQLESHTSPGAEVVDHVIRDRVPDWRRNVVCLTRRLRDAIVRDPAQLDGASEGLVVALVCEVDAALALIRTQVPRCDQATTSRCRPLDRPRRIDWSQTQGHGREPDIKGRF